MATIVKKRGKWFVQIRRSFHKPIYKTFLSKIDAQRYARETERLIEVGQFVEQSQCCIHRVVSKLFNIFSHM